MNRYDFLLIAVLVLFGCGASYSLSERESLVHQTKEILVSNEKVLHKKVESNPCDSGKLCNKYFLVFNSETYQVNWKTYNKVIENQTVTLTLNKEEITLKSGLLILFSLFSIIGIFLTFIIPDDPEIECTEYHDY